MATRLLQLMPRLRRVLLGNGRQVSFNRVRDIPPYVPRSDYQRV